MKTAKKPKPLNLTSAQARRLIDTGRLLVVAACEPQPQPETEVILPANTTPPQVWLYRWDGPLRYDTLEPVRRMHAPYAAGDVVPCREKVETALIDNRIRHIWQLIGKPVVESEPECRMVKFIGMHDCISAGFPKAINKPSSGPIEAFEADWHRRYRRRGSEYAFDRAFAFFTTLVLTKETADADRAETDDCR